MNEMLSWLPLYAEAGFMALPLYFASLLGLGITLYKIWFFGFEFRLPSEEYEQLREAVTSGNSSAPAALAGQRSLTGVLARAWLQGITSPAATRLLRASATRAQAYNAVLAAIATVSPMLGLLGTVVGMIEAFAAIEQGGLGDPALLAAGIKQALYTTAMGLSVAVPALLVHRWSVRLGTMRVAQLADAVDDLTAMENAAS